MKKDFKQELTELINKHGLEKEMRDTPDFILAQVCIDAMAVFSEAIAGLLKQINADASGKPQNDIPEEVKEVAGKLAKAFGARVEIHRIEIPEKKRKFRKKPRKEQGNETR
jgi:hypothetical protein